MFSLKLRTTLTTDGALKMITMAATENEEHIKQTVRGFLLSSINMPNINDEDNLFEMGIVNSLFAVQLMTFIEKTFNLEVETDDLEIENFKSVSATTAFVMKKNGWRTL